MPNFVKPINSDSICIQFHCSECKKQFITTIDDFSKSFVCSQCGAVVNTLPIFCQYQGCPGRYVFRCGGTIKRLSGDERAIEEKKAIDSELDVSVGARPTDSFHDDMQDIRGSTITYRCDKCGDSYSLSQAISKGLDSGNEKCQRIICDTCGRFPNAKELPEPDIGVDNSPLKRFYYN
jgi:DNA-directed RNA polymerase subunit RPC12/RpoP